MEHPVNGIHDVNGHNASALGLAGEPSQEELERELPFVEEGQVKLREVLSRLVQAIYAELTEMAETLPNMSDTARKRTIADWVVKTKKQVVKLYAVMKWSRDASDVQKAMNITAFLMDQNRQFDDVMNSITAAKDALGPARLRNHDLLTALDVLTTGTYLRLPSEIKKIFTPISPLTDEEVKKTLQEMENIISYRLRMHEIIPVEMSNYVVEDGRVHFTVPGLFKTSLSLKGAKKGDGWFFVDIEFLHTVTGDLSGLQDFPRRPEGVLKRHITEEADGRLGFYLPIPDEAIPPGVDPPARPQLSVGTVDVPLVRLFNYLQLLSLSYQLEILFFQAQRQRSLGWSNYLTLERNNDNKSFTASYWVRSNSSGRAPPNSLHSRMASFGGKLLVSIIETKSSLKSGGGPQRTPRARVLSLLQRDGKTTGARQSDEIETFKFEVKWEPAKGALGVDLPPGFALTSVDELCVNPDDLNFETLLRKVLLKHIHGLLTVIKGSLENGRFSIAFPPGEITIVTDNGPSALKVHLCAGELVVVSIDPRTGRFTLRDTGDLAAAGRVSRYAILTDKINENPSLLYDALVHLRYNTIVELAEQKAHYLGLQTFRARNLSQEEMLKFGPSVRATLFIQLSTSPRHYLVLIVTDTEIRFALIEVNILENTPLGNLEIKDIGWVDVRRIHGSDVLIRDSTNRTSFDKVHTLNALDVVFGADRFTLETEVLRELYAYCCARVAYANVELQLKMRGIPYTYLNNNTPGATFGADQSNAHSSLARSVPGLCVQSSDILAGAPAVEAAMPNIRIIPLNWWTKKKMQVVTCVKLKYVQQPVGKRAGTSTVIRPSKRIMYDTREAVVSFLSENVDTCVDEFVEEWARVSKMVVIAREIAQMSKQKKSTDVRLLSFDLQTVEFAYAGDYAVAITCTDQLLASSTGTYELFFSRIPRRFNRSSVDKSSLTVQGFEADNEDATYNPHEEAEQFLRHVLKQGSQLSSSLQQLITLLRDSLPIACVVDSIKKNNSSKKEEAPQTIEIDAFPKAAGWYRIIYGDSRHALDFRLMSGRRVAILDAAQHLFLSSDIHDLRRNSSSKHVNSSHPPTPTLTAKSKPGTGSGGSKNKADEKGKGKAAASNSNATLDHSDNSLAALTRRRNHQVTLTELGILRPIPQMAGIVSEVVRDALRSIGQLSASAPTTTVPSATPGFLSTLTASFSPGKSGAVPSTLEPPYGAPSPAAGSGAGSGSNMRSSSLSPSKIRLAQIDIGLICSVDTLHLFAPRIHERVCNIVASSTTASSGGPSVLSGSSS